MATLNTGLNNNSPQDVDLRKMKVVNGVSTPYASLTEAFTALGSFKYIGRTVIVDDGSGPKEYWFVGGTAQSNLVQKTVAPATSAVLSGTSWDIKTYPVRELSLVGDTAITTTNAVNGVSRGILFVTGNNHVLTINGQAVTLAVTGVTWVNVAVLSTGTLSIVVENAVGASAGTGSTDTTAPTVTSVTATDSHTFRVVFSESVTATIAGWLFGLSGSEQLAPTSVSGSANTWDFVVAQTYASGQTITWNYTQSSGITKDAANNALATVSGTVTNSIPVATPTASAVTWGVKSNVTEVYGGLIKDAVGIGYNDYGLSNDSIGSGEAFEFLMADGTATMIVSYFGLVADTNTSYATANDVLNDLQFHYGFYDAFAVNVQDTAGEQAGGTFAANDKYRIKWVGSSMIYLKSIDGGTTWTTILTTGKVPTGRYKAVVVFQKDSASFQNIKKIA